MSHPEIVPADLHRLAPDSLAIHPGKELPRPVLLNAPDSLKLDASQHRQLAGLLHVLNNQHMR